MSEQILVDPRGVEIHVEGEGRSTIVMVHGWPDTWRLWDAQVRAFAPRYRCARFSLPGFDATEPRRAWSLDEVVDAIARVVDTCSPDAPVILMAHDWGCLFGYQYAIRHPRRVERVIGLDIGDLDSREYRRSLSAKARAMIFGYQVWLAIGWRIGGAIGNRMTRAMARWLRAPGEPATIGAWMNYPYDILWTGSHGSYRAARRFVSQVPMMFVYGTRKPFMFHSPGWARALAENPANRVLALDTGHWMMVRRADAFNIAVLAWLDADAASDAASAPD